MRDLALGGSYLDTVEDQGMGIIPWEPLGGEQLLSAEQRKERDQEASGQRGFYSLSSGENSCGQENRTAEHP
ncbi:putative NADP-dependent oxidoreductase domain-containing protein [Seiridium cardinale]|uniref:NADP-dependent oxidoreductase domain-containing protein n=1 Tax=Seiridium cardinale TaxID=138064 RepID=A0ABR2Y9R2_9PEZI